MRRWWKPLIRPGSEWNKLILFEPLMQRWADTTTTGEPGPCATHFKRTCGLLKRQPALHRLVSVRGEHSIAQWVTGEPSGAPVQHFAVPGEVGIFRMGPASALVSHTGSTNLRLTAHLPLVVPGEALLRELPSHWNRIWGRGDTIKTVSTKAL